MARNIELFYHPFSFYSQKVRMYLCEKGVTPTLHLVDMNKDEQLEPDFLRMNPAGMIPVLKVGQTIVPDSHEIFKYGEDNIPGDTLVPSHIADDVWKLHDEIHALKLRIISFGCLIQPKFSENVMMPSSLRKNLIKRFSREEGLKGFEARLASAPKEFTSIISEKIDEKRKCIEKVHNEESVIAEIEAADKILEQCEAQIEQSSGPFLFGATVTIADIDLIVLMMRLTMLGLKERMFSPTGPRKNLTRFLDTMEKRESFQLIKKEIKRSMFTQLFVYPLVAGALVILGLAVGISVFVNMRRISK